MAAVQRAMIVPPGELIERVVVRSGVVALVGSVRGVAVGFLGTSVEDANALETASWLSEVVDLLVRSSASKETAASPMAVAAVTATNHPMKLMVCHFIPTVCQRGV